MKELTVVHLNGQCRSVRFEWAPEGPWVIVHWGKSRLSGTYRFSVNHGWGEKGAESWRIDRGDLAELRQARGRKIRPCGRSSGRKKAPRRPAPVHPKQLHFGES